MIPNSFPLGPFTIHIYGLVIAIAVLLGWIIAKRRAPLYKISPALFDDPLLLSPLILGTIGGRLYHVIDKWGFYSQSPDQILAITNGGLGIFGALAGVFIGFWIFARFKKINFLSLFDLVSPSLILGQAIGRIGNFVNQEAFGPPTNLPWGVYIDPAHRPIQYLFQTHFHPTFFYEAILELIAFFLLIVLAKRFYSSSDPPAGGESRSFLKIGKFRVNSNNKPGSVFGLYLILYGASRGVAEIWRIDTAKLGDIKVAYLLSLLLILIGIRLLSLREK
ncbi:prolipoprotein diacylglyceryl transferase [Candidatus Curtissbacteria bacterium]|nr:prolipoprotein diacylglyceryl transferase [Candidatus Curtissbacteria bacterium]